MPTRPGKALKRSYRVNDTQLRTCVHPSFWQALGILVLSKILFGGFGGGHKHAKFHNKHDADWHGKWMHMNPEEREKMKAEWSERCGTKTE